MPLRSFRNFVVDGWPVGTADGDVAIDDYADFRACLLGPDGGFSTECECFDFDNDTNVDLDDFAAYQTNFTGG